jgi:hypothetical protein
MNRINLLFLVFIIVILAIILTCRKENFTVSHKPPKKELILNLLPGFDKEILGTFIPQKGKTQNSNNFVYSRSLMSNTWYGPVEN